MSWLPTLVRRWASSSSSGMLEREIASVKQKIRRLKHATQYPKKKNEVPVSIYVESRNRNMQIAPGLGSANNKPSFPDLYRHFRAEWQLAPAEERLPYEEMASQNKQINLTQFTSWQELHQSSGQAAKLKELESALRRLKKLAPPPPDDLQ